MIHTQINSGVSNARNSGIELAKGEYILFVDPDDTVGKEYLHSIFNAVELYDKPDILYFGFNKYVENENDEIIGSSQYLPIEKYCYSNRRDVFNHIFHRYIGYSNENIRNWRKNAMLEMGACWRAAYSRKLLINNNIRFNSNIRLNEDSMFNALAIVYASKTASIDKCLYDYYLRRTGALSTLLASKIINNKEETFKERERIVKLAQTEGFDVDEECYAGSVVMGIIEIFVKSEIADWKKVKKIVSSYIARKCIDTIPFNNDIKYNICVLFLKARLCCILFLLLQIAKKLGIKMAM